MISRGLPLPYGVERIKRLGYVTELILHTEVEELAGGFFEILAKSRDFARELEGTDWIDVTVVAGYEGTIYIIGNRPMSDTEKTAAARKSAAAMRAAATRREKKLAKERAKYEKLKAKFGDA
jgi:hypothetical protein